MPPKGAITGRTVLSTVSTGILASGDIQLCGDFLCRPDAGQVRPVTGALPTIDGGLTGKEQAFIDRAFQIGALVADCCR